MGDNKDALSPIVLEKEVAESFGSLPHILKRLPSFRINRMQVVANIDHQYWGIKLQYFIPSVTFHDSKSTFVAQRTLYDLRMTGNKQMGSLNRAIHR